MTPKRFQSIRIKGKIGNILPLFVCIYRTCLKGEENLNYNQNA